MPWFLCAGKNWAGFCEVTLDAVGSRENVVSLKTKARSFVMVSLQELESMVLAKNADVLLAPILASFIGAPIAPLVILLLCRLPQKS